jgi:indole-3-glycerol phosphate synthase
MSEAKNSGNILLRIRDARLECVEHRKRVLPLAALKVAIEKKASPPRDFASALTANRINVIAELKKKSPSRGLIRETFNAAQLATELADAGAAALSVLTEEEFFSGSLVDLKEARTAVQIPVLRKDFIFDPWQVWEARAAFADSFLLIVALLESDLLTELLELGRSLKMEPLVEVHSPEELSIALDCGAKIVGVNNRDLTNFEVRLETALALAGKIPEACIAVAESGISSGEDLESLSRAGYDAFLIGEHLMKQPSPGDALRTLLSGAVAKLEQS